MENIYLELYISLIKMFLNFGLGVYVHESENFHVIAKYVLFSVSVLFINGAIELRSNYQKTNKNRKL